MLGWWTEPNESGGKPLLARSRERGHGVDVLSQVVGGSLVGRPGTRPAICHAIRELRMCLATGEAAGTNLHGVLPFQHCPGRFESKREGQINFMGRVVFLAA
jgi:hypothetical protein